MIREVTNDANLSEAELIELINDSLKENNMDIKDYNYEKIINNYLKFCSIQKDEYVYGELDTFTRAGCLVKAINVDYNFLNKEQRARVALDTAYKMCEKPYYNVGAEADIPLKLEEVNFKEIFKEDQEFYDITTDCFFRALMAGSINVNPDIYALNLRTLYDVALLLKKRHSHSDTNNNKEENVSKRTRRLFNRFISKIR